MKKSNILKVLIFFLAIIVCCNSAQCKVAGIYSYSGIEDESVSFHLTLYKNRNYELVAVTSGIDTYHVSTISTGKYNIIKTDIVLKEILNGYKMIFSYNKNYITAKSAFKCFMNKRFEKSKEKVPPYPYYPKSEFNLLNYLRNEYGDKNQPLNHLIYGSYGVNNVSTLEIKENHEFTLKFGDYILSEGFWSKNRNEIKFFDTIMKFNFYGFVKRQGIVFAFFSKSIINLELMKKDKNKTKSKK